MNFLNIKSVCMFSCNGVDCALTSTLVSIFLCLNLLNYNMTHISFLFYLAYIIERNVMKNNSNNNDFVKDEHNAG